MRMPPIDILFKGAMIVLLLVLLFDNSRMRKQNERLGSDISGLSSDFKPLNYYELGMAMPSDFLKANPWDAMAEALSPFYTYATDF